MSSYIAIQAICTASMDPSNSLDKLLQGVSKYTSERTSLSSAVLLHKFF